MFAANYPGELPDHFFFDPVEAFLLWIKSKDREVLDVGAGTGQFQHRMNKKFPDVKMRSIDLNRREGYKVPVAGGFDGQDFPYHPDVLTTICRPDHSGWCEYAFKRMLERGVKDIYYVGLERNFEFDLLGLKYVREFVNAGSDGEHAWRITGVDEEAK